MGGLGHKTWCGVDLREAVHTRDGGLGAPPPEVLADAVCMEESPRELGHVRTEAQDRF